MQTECTIDGSSFYKDLNSPSSTNQDWWCQDLHNECDLRIGPQTLSDGLKPRNFEEDRTSQVGLGLRPKLNVRPTIMYQNEALLNHLRGIDRIPGRSTGIQVDPFPDRLPLTRWNDQFAPINSGGDLSFGHTFTWLSTSWARSGACDWRSKAQGSGCATTRSICAFVRVVFL